jgi:hypothetical protein
MPLIKNNIIIKGLLIWFLNYLFPFINLNIKTIFKNDLQGGHSPYYQRSQRRQARKFLFARSCGLRKMEGE